MSNDMIWTDEKIEDLRVLWAEGLPTAEIGRRLNVSKNAIIGKAHRLGLDARPSPIAAPLDPDVLAKVKDLLQCGRTPKEVSIITGIKHVTASMIRWRMDLPKLPPQRTMTRIAPRRPLVVRVQPEMPPAPVIHLVLAPKPVIEAPMRAEAPKSPRPVRECCWPIGEPRTKAFRFCGGAAVLGKPYCEGHCRDGYTKVRDRDREQAA